MFKPIRHGITAAMMLTGAIASEPLSIQKTVEYQHSGKTYASRLVGPADAKNAPMVFMIPNWMGATDRAVEKARHVSNGQFLVYVADVYGKDVRPANAGEAGAVAGSLRADRAEMRDRGEAALAHFRTLAAAHGGDPERMAAIGFCFGGGMILEMARAGADARHFVSFHGDLASPTLDADSEKIRGKVLVLHGAADPLVPLEHVNAFKTAMGKTDVDWTLVAFGGAVHSFTDPTAAMPGTAMYCERTATRAFNLMWHFLDE